MNDFDIKLFPEPGLYILTPDGKKLALTHKEIEQSTSAILKDKNAIPDSVRDAAEYKPCDICPERKTAVICHAIMPIIPFFNEIDKYMSYDKVTAVYREKGTDSLVVTDIKMSEALKFITILSLMDYCEVGHKYLDLFDGINPMMTADKIAKIVFKNIYFKSHGNIERIQKTVYVMSDEILHTAKCQVARLNLICNNDAFVNAYINTDLITSFIRKEMREYIALDK